MSLTFTYHRPPPPSLPLLRRAVILVSKGFVADIMSLVFTKTSSRLSSFGGILEVVDSELRLQLEAVESE